GGGDDEHKTVFQLGVAFAESYRKGLLASSTIGVDVAEIVDDKDADGQRTDGNGRDEGERGEVLRLDVGSAGGGRQAKEKEDEDLAQAEIGQWPGTAGVGHGTDDGRNAQDENGPAAT